MKILLVDSGVQSSTGDVFRGMRNAFGRANHQVIPYQLGARIEQADYALDKAWQQAGKPEQRPTGADVYYRASEGILSFALRHQPDVVLVVTSQWFHPDLIVFLRRAGFPVGLICTESPYGLNFEAHFLMAANFGWTQERACVARLREQSGNPHVRYLAAAWDPTLHHQSDLDDVDCLAHDVVLVATGFAERIALLKKVDWTGIDFGLYGDWRVLPRRSPLRKHLRGGIQQNAQAAALYRKATIGLNLYRDGLILAGEPGGTLSYADAEPFPAESLNPRAYELAACGVCQVSQERAEVKDVFGDSVPTFRTPAELGATLRELLAKPERRAALAERARFAVAGHTFDDRVGQIVRDIDDYRAATRPVAISG